jgi:hypothetical protein
MVRRVNIALTVIEKANFKERGSRGDEKKRKEKIGISSLASVIILTTSTNTDFNISKLDKFYLKYVWEKIKK